MGGQKYTAGDYVLLNGTKRKLICRLTGFIKNMTDGQATAAIEWVYWPEEMARELRVLPLKKRPQMPDYAPGDVFLSNFRDSVGIGTIACKVSVISRAPLHPVPLQLKRSNDRFYARWHWNTDTKKFTPVSEDSTKGGHRKSWVGAVILAANSAKSNRGPQESPKPQGKMVSPANLHQSPRESPSKTTLGKEVSISLSRTSPASAKVVPASKTKRLLHIATILSPNRPLPKFSSPSSISQCKNGPDGRVGFKSKSHPQKMVISPTHTQTPPPQATTRRKSTASARGLIDEHPLPLGGNKTPTALKGKRRDGKLSGEKRESEPRNQELIAASPLRRHGRLNACDVVCLLSEEEESECAESSSDEEQGGAIRRERSGRKSDGRCASKRIRNTLNRRGPVQNKSTKSEVGDDLVGDQYISSSSSSSDDDEQREREKEEKGREETEKRKVERGKGERKEREKEGRNEKEKEKGKEEKGEREGKEREKQKKVKGNQRTVLEGKRKGSVQAHIPEDILPNNFQSDIVTTPVEKKWSLRTKSQVKPPAYLVTSSAISATRQSQLEISRLCEEEKVFKIENRKRGRSSSPIRDLLVEEPAGKRVKPSQPARLESQRAKDRGNKLRSQMKQKRGGKGGAGDVESDREVGKELVVKTPQSKEYSLRPHTVPRNSRLSTRHVVEDRTSSTNCDHMGGRAVTDREGIVGRNETEGRKRCASEMGGNAKTRDTHSKLGSRRLRISRFTGHHEGSMEDSGDEYEPGSVGESSESHDSTEEEEEEDEEEEPCKPPSRSQRRPSRRTVHVNWSPEDDDFRPTQRPAKRAKTPKQSKTLHLSKVSTTPTTTPAVKTPRSRLMVTPHIPQKKKAGTAVKQSDFDRARLRYSVTLYMYLQQECVSLGMKKHATPHA